MRTVIYPYKMGSETAWVLSRALGARRLRVNGTYLPRSGDFIINLGASIIPRFSDALRGVQGLVFLNRPEAVRNASNKLRAFRILQEAGVSIPEFTTDNSTASQWIRQGFRVFAREVLNGHSGAGIRVITAHPTITTTVVPAAPLYVKQIRNRGEYRVHVVKGRVIDYIKKRRRNGEPATEAQNEVRNLENGWVYTRQNLRRLERIEQLAIRAVEALGLDFGAVDIIKDQNGDVFVLEVNTAPGMSDTTLAAYTDAFTRLIEEHASNQ